MLSIQNNRARCDERKYVDVEHDAGALLFRFVSTCELEVGFYLFYDEIDAHCYGVHIGASPTTSYVWSGVRSYTINTNKFMVLSIGHCMFDITYPPVSFGNNILLSECNLEISAKAREVEGECDEVREAEAGEDDDVSEAEVMAIDQVGAPPDIEDPMRAAARDEKC